jgi:hypothetical protein
MLVFFITILIIILWTFAAILGLDSHESTSDDGSLVKHLQWFSQPENYLTMLITGLAFLLLLGGIVAFNSDKDIWKSLAPELVGIAMTILVVDKLYQFRSEQLEKRQVIRQIASHSNEFALEAVRIAREKGWLTDGTLRNASLAHANLKGADLSQADLRGANLFAANLEGAWLSNESQGYYLSANMLPFFLQSDDIIGADLRGANLNYATLNEAVLAKANLTDANLEFSWLIKTNLIGANLTNANFWGAHLFGTDLRNTNLAVAKLDWTKIHDITENSETKWHSRSGDTEAYG